MIRSSERRRVLVAAAVLQPIQQLFAHDILDRWELLEADTFSMARFTLQYNPCDVLVINDDLLEQEGHQGMAWLAWQKRIPMVYLSGPCPGRFAKALEVGITNCLPWDLAFAQPSLLDRALDQAHRVYFVQAEQNRLRQQLNQSRQHLDRLATLLWRTSPRHGDRQWYPHRHMLDRLQEELARTERHKSPLTIAVGEVGGVHDDSPGLLDWSADVIVRAKRRCDVAGQYGPQGFMLLMVQTPQAGGVKCCKRLQQILEMGTGEVEGMPQSVRAYFGVTTTLGESKTAQAILRMAEQNLEAARNLGRDRIVVA